MTNIDVRQIKILQYENSAFEARDGGVAWLIRAMLPTGDIDTDDLREEIQQLAIESHYDGYQIDDNRRFHNMGMSISSQEIILTILTGVASGAAGAFVAAVISRVNARQNERESEESGVGSPMILVPDLQESTGLVKETLTSEFGLSEVNISIVSSEVSVNGAKIVAKDTEHDQVYEATVSNDGLLLEVRQQDRQS